MKYTYPEIFSRLTYETAFLIFMKKNGEVRIMLATRNMNTISLQYGFQGKALGGHDNRCSINNGNIAVFDLVLGEARSFHIDRLIDIQFQGVIDSMDKLNNAAERFTEFKNNYEANNSMELDMSMLE